MKNLNSTVLWFLVIRMMRKFTTTLIAIFLLITAHQTIIAREALAHCPLCVAGTGAGLVLSRWLGIDDSISGVWIAAFLGATSFWLGNTLKKKYLPLQDLVIYLSVFGLTLWSFYAFNLIDNHAGLIMGIPKLTFGIVTGGIVFYLVEVGNAFIKKKRGKVLFAYQPIVFSLVAILVLSAAIYIFINYFI